MNLEIFLYPFMQRALIAGIASSVLLGLLGVFVTARRMAFFGDGIAHSALFGIALATFFGWAPMPIAIIFSVLVALLIARLERTTRLPSDALIGITFTASMAAGIVILSFKQGYQPELVSYLFGSILSITQTDLWVILGATAIITFGVLIRQRQLTFLTLSEESAAVSGIPVNRYVTLLYCALAIAVIIAAKMLGVILVSALLIMPAATSRLLTTTFRSHISTTMCVAILTSIVGLVTSVMLGAPSGATIVLVGAAFFLLASTLSFFRK